MPAPPGLRVRALSDLSGATRSLAALPSSLVGIDEDGGDSYDAKWTKSNDPSSPTKHISSPISPAPAKRSAYETVTRNSGSSSGVGSMGGSSGGLLGGRAMTMDKRVPNAIPAPLDGAGSQLWHFDNMPRKEAEDLIQGQPVGTFLVRTTDGNSAITMVLRDGSLSHFKILTSGSKLFVMGDEEITFSTLSDLVHFYYTHQITRNGDHFVGPCPR